MIGCEDRLRNDLYCVEWGVKLYSNQPAVDTHRQMARQSPFPVRPAGRPAPGLNKTRAFFVLERATTKTRLHRADNTTTTAIRNSTARCNPRGGVFRRKRGGEELPLARNISRLANAKITVLNEPTA